MNALVLSAVLAATPITLQQGREEQREVRKPRMGCDQRDQGIKESGHKFPVSVARFARVRPNNSPWGWEGPFRQPGFPALARPAR